MYYRQMSKHRVSWSLIKLIDCFGSLQLASAALTYHTLFAIVPVMALMTAIAKGLGYDEMFIQSVRNFLQGQEAISDGLLLYAPAYHVLATYPQGNILCVENLKFAPIFRDVDFSVTTLLKKKTPEEQESARAQMTLLAQLADAVLEDGSDTNIAAYHRQLACVLTDQQMQMYLKVTGCE